MTPANHKYEYDLTLHESVAVLSYLHRHLLTTHKILSTYLCGDSYILPDFRCLNESALRIPYAPYININTSIALSQFHFYIILETYYTSTEQSNIIRYIQCYMKQHQQKLKIQSIQES
jgi:hypothetical protein